MKVFFCSVLVVENNFEKGQILYRRFCTQCCTKSTEFEGIVFDYPMGVLIAFPEFSFASLPPGCLRVASSSLHLKLSFIPPSLLSICHKCSRKFLVPFASHVLTSIELLVVLVLWTAFNVLNPTILTTACSSNSSFFNVSAFNWWSFFMTFQCVCFRTVENIFFHFSGSQNPFLYGTDLSYDSSNLKNLGP